ncbi:MAG: hypothetical protein WCR02_01935 [Sphaerochaetaceae bacterium]
MQIKNSRNTAFAGLLESKGKELLLDANIFIPPDRSSSFSQYHPLSFIDYCEIWLTPLFNTFTGVAIHSAVYQEIVKIEQKAFVDQLIKDNKLAVVNDSMLDSREKTFRDTIETKLIHTGLLFYDSQQNNKKDRGEVKTLSYAAAKGIHLFSTYDHVPVELVTHSEKLQTGLDSISIIYGFELIHALTKLPNSNKSGLRKLYKDLYYFSPQEKKSNPNWEFFLKLLDSFYC